MNEDLKVQLGKWIIVCEDIAYYEVEIDELSSWNGGCVSGMYYINGKKIGYGCFSFKDITKMEKILTKEECVV